MSTTTIRRRAGAAPLVLSALLLAACSGAPSSAPSVAALGSSTPASASTAPASGSAYQNALKYSQCMRSHGVPKFPDPQVSGDGKAGIQLNKGSGIDPNSPQFQSAQKTCQPLMKAGQPGDATPFDPTKIGKWTACIRSHGIPNFPDPTNTGSGLKLSLTGTGIDPNQMEKAMSSCKADYPGGSLMMQAGGPGSGSRSEVGGGS